jgi:hypothetical protein
VGGSLLGLWNLQKARKNFRTGYAIETVWRAVNENIRNGLEVVFPRVNGATLLLSGARFLPKALSKYDALPRRFVCRRLAKQLVAVSLQCFYVDVSYP